MKFLKVFLVLSCVLSAELLFSMQEKTLVRKKYERKEKMTDAEVQKMIEEYQTKNSEKFNHEEYERKVEYRDELLRKRAMDLDALNELIEKYTEENNMDIVEALEKKVYCYRNLYQLSRNNARANSI